IYQEMAAADAVALQDIDAAKESLLVADIVPRRIQSPLAEAIVEQIDRRQGGGRFLVDHANVDALVQTDLKTAAPDLVEPRLPLLARLAEEIVVEQMQMPRPRLAAPDIGNLVH